MTNLETIRAACIKANPSILDLKFGCELKNKYTSNDYDKNNVYIKNYSGDDYWIFRPSFEELTHSEKSSFEILGRPIRLADVLVAIKTNRRTTFEKWLRASDFLVIRSQWKMDQDDLGLFYSDVPITKA